MFEVRYQRILDPAFHVRRKRHGLGGKIDGTTEANTTGIGMEACGAPGAEDPLDFGKQGDRAAGAISGSGFPQDQTIIGILGDATVSFTYWEKPDDFKGWDAVVAGYAQPRSNGKWKDRVPPDLDALKAHFDKVDDPETLIINRGGSPLRRYQYFRCYGYRGSRLQLEHVSSCYPGYWQKRQVHQNPDQISTICDFKTDPLSVS